MKRFVTSMILGTMIISSASMSFASAKPMEKITFSMSSQPAYELAEATEVDWDLDGDLEDLDMTDYEMPSFDDYMKESKDFMKTIDKASKSKLKGLYEEAIKLDKAEKYDDATKKWDAFYEVFDKFVDEKKLEKLIVDCEDIDDAIEGDVISAKTNISFDDQMKELKEFLKDIPSKDMTKLKSLYEAADKYIDEEKFEKADKAYDEFYTLLDKYFKDDIKMTELEGDEFEMPSYKDFMKDMSEFLKPVSKEDAKSLEKLYNKAVAAEKNSKYEDANKDWEAFDKILDKYFKDEVKTQ
jgi:TolA-binding protein